MKTKVWLMMLHLWWGDPATNPDAWKLPPVPKDETVYVRRRDCVKSMREWREQFPETVRQSYSCVAWSVKR